VLQAEHGMKVTRACGLINISLSLYRYHSGRPDCAQLRERMSAIAAEKRRYGYRRIHVLLRREGWKVNWKKVYRLYRELGLAVRRRKRKRIGPFQRVPLPRPTAANQSWSMDFVADGLADGRRLRCLTIVDDHSRECPAIEVDTSITGTRVVAVLERLADERGLRRRSRSTTAPSSKAKCSTRGRMLAACGCRSYGRASRSRTRTSKVSTASSATSA
jgi:putative transposase